MIDIKDKMIKDKLCPSDMDIKDLEDYTNDCEYDNVVYDCDYCRKMAWTKYIKSKKGRNDISE